MTFAIGCSYWKALCQPDFLSLKRTFLYLDVIKILALFSKSNIIIGYESVLTVWGQLSLSVYTLTSVSFQEKYHKLYSQYLFFAPLCLFSFLGVSIIEMLDSLCLSSISFSPHPFLKYIFYFFPIVSVLIFMFSITVQTMTISFCSA